MIVAWFGYCLLISALLGVAALAAERALGHYRKPVRWVWAAAIAGSLILPIAAYVAPTLVARFSTVSSSLPVSVTRLPGLDFTGAPAEAGFDWGAALSFLGTGLGIFWILSIAALGGYLFVAQRRLRREMEEWTPGEILDAQVLMSKDRGPAVVGVRRGVIVMPAWIPELEEDVLRLVFLHEREHQLAGDHRLFALAMVGVVAMPWNPFAWWQLRRLRLAIEFDCDRRVIRHGILPRDYAEALLAVGSRVTSLPLAAAAFAERRPAVERRLRRMTEPLRRLRGPRAAAAIGLGALAVVVACGSPIPTANAVRDEVVGKVRGLLVKEKADAADTGGEPMFLPYDTAPVLQNRAEIVEALQEAYPADLKDAGIGGRVETWIYVDEEGNVANTRVKSPSGNAALDEAAIEVVRRMEFSPAANQGTETPAWVSQWVTFQLPGGEMIEPEGKKPFTVDPKLRRVMEAEDRATVGGVLRRQDPQAVEDPLIVVDGVIQGPGVEMADLKALDIDHVEIIKGAAAVQLYGERARNGVVQIVTVEGVASHGGREFRVTEVRPDEPVPARVAAELITKSPLIVIDGVIQAPGATLSDIGELDIESVEVIKGEAAQQLYGERAKDGVILIKTKDGG